MGRQRRPYLPGAIFHLTARTIRRERWFTPRLRTTALRILADTVPRSDARLLAVAIMSNHLHLIVQQGTEPTARLMQPFLRRIALRLQRAHRFDGPVFWRHYASRPCLDPTHARNAIVYTHLNPVRAGLCSDPAEYPWTSHALYGIPAAGAAPAQLDPLRPVIDPALVLPLFASDSRGTLRELRDSYSTFVDRRMRADASQGDDPDELAVTNAPASRTRLAGLTDRPWGDALTPLFHVPAHRTTRVEGQQPPSGTPDMTAVARVALELEGATLAPSALRGRGGGRERSRLRHVVIRRLRAAGYRSSQIARYLDLSESAIWYAVHRAAPDRTTPDDR